MREEYDRLLNEEMLSHFMIAFGFVVFAMCQLFFQYFNVYPSPFMTIASTATVIAYTAIHLWRRFPELRRLRLGIDGEKAVGQYLDELRSMGYAVFHDIQTPRGNIDHVLVGTGGIFAIETKTISKPTDHDAVISYDGANVRVDGFSPDRDPISQTLALANELSTIVERATQSRPDVRPVVLYPGWYVEKQPKGVKVWVLAPRAFPGFLKHEPGKLTDAQVAGVRSAIDAYARSYDANRRNI